MADGLATFNAGISLDGVSLTTVQISSEAFADNDTSLMTSAAINDRIIAAAPATTQADLHVDDIHSALGIASEAVNFGTFTGSTISDNGTLKAGVQELETATELKAPLASPTLTGTVNLPAATNFAAASDFDSGG